MTILFPEVLLLTCNSDFADQYPDANVIGTDLSPMQPTWTPQNMKFEIDDATLPWTWDENRFGFIHMRYLMGSIRDYGALFKQAFAHTKPGGLIESVEIDSDFRSDDGTVDGVPALQKWNELFREAGKATGAVFSVIADDLQRKGLAAAGYVDIEAKTFKVGLLHQLNGRILVVWRMAALTLTGSYGWLGARPYPRGDWSHHQRCARQ